MPRYPVTFDCNGEVFVAHNASEQNLYYVWECGQNHQITSMPTIFTNTYTASSAEPTITWPVVEEDPFPVTLGCGNDTLVVSGKYSDLEAAYECGLKQSIQNQQDETSGAGATSSTLSGLVVALLALSVFV